ncbi:MAG TPA: hypothetical protein VFH27_02715, partial [Longimicrobiaceae bacterium]|nr:hypothetical protein [Longimicrobiaceae bacterium]
MLHRILSVVAAVALLGACDAAPTAVARPPHAPHATLLTAYVQGSSAARYGDTCLYEAIASGGTAPYTYKWGTLQSGWDL